MSGFSEDGVPAEWYDAEYYEGPTKSSYQPYGPGDWADWLVQMVKEYLRPSSVLDVGCAYGFVVQRLLLQGIEAFGFDHSPTAVRRAVLGPTRIWRGDLTDRGAWRSADLVLCTEVLEHLTDAQAREFFYFARTFGNRLLILVTTPESEHGEEDESHINLQPMTHWSQMGFSFGWKAVERESYYFNLDQRSETMGWAGRFLYMVRENNE